MNVDKRINELEKEIIKIKELVKRGSIKYDNKY